MPKINQTALPVSDKVRAFLEQIPDAHTGTPGHKWTAEEDAILLAGWGKKNQVALAEALGLSENTCRKRWRLLTAEGKS